MHTWTSPLEKCTLNRQKQIQLFRIETPGCDLHEVYRLLPCPPWSEPGRRSSSDLEWGDKHSSGCHKQLQTAEAWMSANTSGRRRLALPITDRPQARVWLEVPNRRWQVRPGLQSESSSTAGAALHSGGSTGGLTLKRPSELPYWRALTDRYPLGVWTILQGLWVLVWSEKMPRTNMSQIYVVNNWRKKN